MAQPGTTTTQARAKQQRQARNKGNRDEIDDSDIHYEPQFYEDVRLELVTAIGLVAQAREWASQYKHLGLEHEALGARL